MLGVAVMLFHWVACGWQIVSPRRGGRCTWRRGSPLCDEVTGTFDPHRKATVLQMYLRCLHQGCTSLFADGYAETTGETAYFAVVVLLGAVMQASVLGSVATIMQSINADQRLLAPMNANQCEATPWPCRAVITAAQILITRFPIRIAVSQSTTRIFKWTRACSWLVLQLTHVFEY